MSIEAKDEKQRCIYSEGCLNAINMYCKFLNALLFKHCIKWKEKKPTATDLHFVINSE